MSQKVEYEVLNVEELPEKVQDEILTNSIVMASLYTMIINILMYFIELITMKMSIFLPTLSAHRKKSKYIITSLVDLASNDGFVSYEKVIKLEKFYRR